MTQYPIYVEQTKNEPKGGNKTAPDNKKPKEERRSLTKVQWPKRQRMIILPATVLALIGAMWWIFVPSSDKGQRLGVNDYSTEMPDADRKNRLITGDKAKTYEQRAMKERQKNCNRAVQQLSDLFDHEVAETDDGRDFGFADPDEEPEKLAPKAIQSSAAAYRGLNATLDNSYEQLKNDHAGTDGLLERITSLESELESGKDKVSPMDDQVALMEKSYELAAEYMGGQNDLQPTAR